MAGATAGGADHYPDGARFDDGRGPQPEYGVGGGVGGAVGGGMSGGIRRVAIGTPGWADATARRPGIFRLRDDFAWRNRYFAPDNNPVTGASRFVSPRWFPVPGHWGGEERACRPPIEPGRDLPPSIPPAGSRRRKQHRIPRCKPHLPH